MHDVAWGAAGAAGMPAAAAVHAERFSAAQRPTLSCVLGEHKAKSRAHVNDLVRVLQIAYARKAACKAVAVCSPPPAHGRCGVCPQVVPPARQTTGQHQLLGLYMDGRHNVEGTYAGMLAGSTRQAYAAHTGVGWGTSNQAHVGPMHTRTHAKL